MILRFSAFGGRVLSVILQTGMNMGLESSNCRSFTSSRRPMRDTVPLCGQDESVWRNCFALIKKTTSPNGTCRFSNGLSFDQAKRPLCNMRSSFSCRSMSR